MAECSTAVRLLTAQIDELETLLASLRRIRENTLERLHVLETRDAAVAKGKAPHGAIKRAVVKALQKEEVRLTVPEITERIRRDFLDSNSRSIRNALNRLTSDGVVTKIGRSYTIARTNY